MMYRGQYRSWAITDFHVLSVLHIHKTMQNWCEAVLFYSFIVSAFLYVA